MAFELHVTRRAAAEIERVVQCWAENRPSAPDAVRKDLKAALDILLEQPAIGSRVEQASSPGVRRFHLERVRCWVCYRVRGKRLQVLSIWHASRGRGPMV